MLSLEATPQPTRCVRELDAVTGGVKGNNTDQIVHKGALGVAMDGAAVR